MNNTSLQWKEVKRIQGTIEVLTGLHVGAGKESVEIGGMDQPVIKNPVTGLPYIPGSSLKGKMRSLMEWRLNLVLDNGDTHQCTDANCPICRIFGSTKESNGRGPTRLVVRDAVLSDASRIEFQEKGRPLVEVKYENTINRVTGRAEHPRPLERVTPGTVFDFEILYKVLDDTDEAHFQYVIQGLEAVEADYLGGCGSRGSGQIKIQILDKGSSISPTEYLKKLGA